MRALKRAAVAPTGVGGERAVLASGRWRVRVRQRQQTRDVRSPPHGASDPSKQSPTPLISQSPVGASYCTVCSVAENSNVPPSYAERGGSPGGGGTAPLCSAFAAATSPAARLARSSALSACTEPTPHSASSVCSICSGGD